MASVFTCSIPRRVTRYCTNAPVHAARFAPTEVQPGFLHGLWAKICRLQHSHFRQWWKAIPTCWVGNVLYTILRSDSWWTIHSQKGGGLWMLETGILQRQTATWDSAMWVSLTRRQAFFPTVFACDSLVVIYRRTSLDLCNMSYYTSAYNFHLLTNCTLTPHKNVRFTCVHENGDAHRPNLCPGDFTRGQAWTALLEW